MLLFIPAIQILRIKTCQKWRDDVRGNHFSIATISGINLSVYLSSINRACRMEDVDYRFEGGLLKFAIEE